MGSLLTGEPGLHFFPNSYCDHQAQITTGGTRCGLKCCITNDDYFYKWLSLPGKECACLMDKECYVTEDKEEAVHVQSFPSKEIWRTPLSSVRKCSLLPYKRAACLAIQLWADSRHVWILGLQLFAPHPNGPWRESHPGQDGSKGELIHGPSPSLGWNVSWGVEPGMGELGGYWGRSDGTKAHN